MNELEKVLSKARELKDKYKIKLSEALLLLIAQDLAGIHYHIDMITRKKRI